MYLLLIMRIGRYFDFGGVSRQRIGSHDAVLCLPNSIQGREKERGRLVPRLIFGKEDAIAMARVSPESGSSFLFISSRPAALSLHVMYRNIHWHFAGNSHL